MADIYDPTQAPTPRPRKQRAKKPKPERPPAQVFVAVIMAIIAGCWTFWVGSLIQGYGSAVDYGLSSLRNIIVGTLLILMGIINFYSGMKVYNQDPSGVAIGFFVNILSIFLFLFASGPFFTEIMIGIAICGINLLTLFLGNPKEATQNDKPRFQNPALDY